MPTAMEVSKYILALSSPDQGDVISNLKLQKLLYYSQGVSLALHNKPLFNEPIEAWEYGPVVLEMYQEFKGCRAIDTDNYKMSSKERKSLSFKNKRAIAIAYQEFGQFSAWRLREMTHKELPWLSTEKNCIIETDLIKTYFCSLLSDN